MGIHKVSLYKILDLGTEELLSAFEIDEGEGIGMTVVGGMGFAEGLYPFRTVEIGKEGIGVVGGSIDFRDTKTVGNGECLTIDGCAAYDEDFLGIITALLRLTAAVVKGFFQ